MEVAELLIQQVTVRFSNWIAFSIAILASFTHKKWLFQWHMFANTICGEDDVQYRKSNNNLLALQNFAVSRKCVNIFRHNGSTNSKLSFVLTGRVRFLPWTLQTKHNWLGSHWPNHMANRTQYSSCHMHSPTSCCIQFIFLSLSNFSYSDACWTRRVRSVCYGIFPLFRMVLKMLKKFMINMVNFYIRGV